FVHHEYRNEVEQEAQHIRNGGADHAPQGLALRWRRRGLRRQYHIADEVTEHLRVCPVIVVRFAWQPIAAETEVMPTSGEFERAALFGLRLLHSGSALN